MWNTEERWNNRVEYQSDNGFCVSILRTDYIHGVDPVCDEHLPGRYAINLTFGPIKLWAEEIHCRGSILLTHDWAKDMARQKVSEHLVGEMMAL